MEEKIIAKKVWEIPVLEIINTKLTNSGGHPWNREDAHYTDPYLSS